MILVCFCFIWPCFDKSTPLDTIIKDEKLAYDFPIPQNVGTEHEGKYTEMIIGPLFNWVYRKINPDIGIKAKQYNLRKFFSGLKMRQLKNCDDLNNPVNWPTAEEIKKEQASGGKNTVPMPHVFIQYKDPLFSSYDDRLTGFNQYHTSVKLDVDDNGWVNLDKVIELTNIKYAETAKNVFNRTDLLEEVMDIPEFIHIDTVVDNTT